MPSNAAHRTTEVPWNFIFLSRPGSSAKKLLRCQSQRHTLLPCSCWLHTLDHPTILGTFCISTTAFPLDRRRRGAHTGGFLDASNGPSEPKRDETPGSTSACHALSNGN